jgi:hypothetical protein
MAIEHRHGHLRCLVSFIFREAKYNTLTDMPLQGYRHVRYLNLHLRTCQCLLACTREGKCKVHKG